MTRKSLSLITHLIVNGSSASHDRDHKVQRALRYYQTKSKSTKVTFHDFAALPSTRKSAFGESGFNPLNQHCTTKGSGDLIDTIDRLKSHITQLMDLCQHQHSHYRKQPQHITRILTPEFSLYTRHPLDETVYTHLKNWLLRRAKKMPPNTHLVLSSFAFVLNGKLANTSFYITGGEDATVTPIIKARASATDIDFNRRITPMNQRGTTVGFVGDRISEATLEPHHAPITHNQVLRIRVGDCDIDIATSICFDHCNDMGKALFKQLYKRSNTLHPQQTSYVISSNILEPDLSLSPSHSIRHIDPVYSQQAPRFDCDSAVYKLERPHFGPPVSLYRLNDLDSASPTPEIEQLRRRSNRACLEHRFSITFDLDALCDQCLSLLDDNKTEDALTLLQLLDTPPARLYTALLNCDFALIPSLELNHLLKTKAATLSDQQIKTACLRAHELQDDALECIATEHSRRKLFGVHSNALYQQAKRLPNDIISALMCQPDRLGELKPATLNALSLTLNRSELQQSRLINNVTEHIKRLNDSCRQELMAQCWLMDQKRLRLCMPYISSCDTYLFNAFCHQVARMDDTALHEVIKRADDMNSLSIMHVSSQIDRIKPSGLNALTPFAHHFQRRHLKQLLLRLDVIKPEHYQDIANATIAQAFYAPELLLLLQPIKDQLPPEIATSLAAKSTEPKLATATP